MEVNRVDVLPQADSETKEASAETLTEIKEAETTKAEVILI